MYVLQIGETFHISKIFNATIKLFRLSNTVSILLPYLSTFWLMFKTSLSLLSSPALHFRWRKFWQRASRGFKQLSRVTVTFSQLPTLMLIIDYVLIKTNAYRITLFSSQTIFARWTLKTLKVVRSLLQRYSLHVLRHNLHNVAYYATKIALFFKYLLAGLCCPFLHPFLVFLDPPKIETSKNITNNVKKIWRRKGNVWVFVKVKRTKTK